MAAIHEVLSEVLFLKSSWYSIKSKQNAAIEHNNMFPLILGEKISQSRFTRQMNMFRTQTGSWTL